MRLGIIADIHANLIALEAVLADLALARADQIICLGDVAASGPRPRETVARLRSLNYSTVMGNADEELFNFPLLPAEDVPMYLDVDRWCAAQLSADDLDYLRGFQPTIDVALGDGLTLLCCHGSPRSFNDLIVATTPEDDLAAMLAGYNATVIAGGHTHQQMLRRYRGTILLNPGSVGLPYERGPGTEEVRNPPWAEYAILSQANGRLGIELCRVPIDAGAVAQTIRASGMPHAELLARDWR